MGITATLLASHVTADATAIASITTAAFNSTGYTHLAVWMKHEGTPTVMTASDNKGSLFSKLVQVNHSNNDLSSVWAYGKIGTPGTSHTVTLSVEADKPYQRLAVYGLVADSGRISIRAFDQAQGTATTAVDAGSLVTSVPTVSLMCVGPYTALTYTPSSGWTEDLDNDIFCASRSDSTGTFDPACTMSISSSWVANAVSFNDAANGADFPTTGILDNFNRADQGPPPSASWDYPIGSFAPNGLSVISNTLGRTPSNFGGTYWSASTFGADTEFYVTISTMVGSDTIDIGLLLRIQSPGSGGTGGAGMDGYYVSFMRNSPNYQLIFYRIDNAVFTQLGVTQTPGNLVVGDKIGIRMVGNEIQAYRNTGTGWFVYGAPMSDGTYTGAGYVGTIIADPTGRLDDAGGGTAILTTAFPARWATA